MADDSSDLWIEPGPEPERPVAPNPLWGELELPPGGQVCGAHPLARTDVRCGSCGSWVCGNCRVLSQGRVLCNGCRSATAWRVPRSLRLVLWLSWPLLGLGVAHRLLSPLSPEERLGLGGDPLLWRVWGLLDARLDQWTPLVALVLAGVAFAHARSSQGQTLQLVWRIALVCFLCGGAMVLGSDHVYRLLFGP